MSRYLHLLLILLFFSHSSAQDLYRGLLGCYAFSGDAKDGSGQGRDGTINGDFYLAKDRFGNENSAYRFNGISYISLPTTGLSFSDYSLSVWVLFTFPAPTSSTPPTIYFYEGWIIGLAESPPAWEGLLYWSADFLDADGRSDLFEFRSDEVGKPSPTVEHTSWHHLVLTRHHDSITWYIDGERMYPGPNAFGKPSVQGQVLLARIGGVTADPYPISKEFMGVIDDVAIYNRPLNYDEVQHLYKEGLPCPKEIRVSEFFIPNVLTINGDRINEKLTVFEKVDDEWVPYAGSNSFNMTIINRWGKTIFQTDDGSKGWSGENAEVGLYYYYITLGEKSYKGSVSVLK